MNEYTDSTALRVLSKWNSVINGGGECCELKIKPGPSEPSVIEA